MNLGKWALANLFKGLIKAEEADLKSQYAQSSTKSPAPTHLSIDIPNGNGNGPPKHRARAMSNLSQTPSLNILGIASPAARPALLPDVESPLSRSAPPNHQSFHSFRANQPPSAAPASPGPNSLGTGGGGDYFSSMKRVESSPSREGRAPPTPGGAEKVAPATPAPTTPGGKTMGKFKLFGKKKEKEVMAPVVENEPDVVEEDTVSSHSLLKGHEAN